MRGVDPAPFRRWLLPHYLTLPRPLAELGLGLATVLGLPLDLLAGRQLTGASWHKVFVLGLPAPAAAPAPAPAAAAAAPTASGGAAEAGA